MAITLAFIAEMAQVSKPLVSKVLNNKPVRISKEKRDTILHLAEKYNYKPNRMAAGLRTNKTNLIGCIMPGIYTDFFSELVYYIESTAQQKGYQTILCNTGEDILLERKYLDMYRAGVLDGMIVNPSDNSANLDMFISMKKQGFPFIFVDRHIDEVDASFVCSDGYDGVYLLTEELLKKGHRKIMFLAHGKSRNTSVQIERYEGYSKAMTDRGLNAVRVFMTDDQDVKNREIYKIFSDKNRPTAVVLVSSWDMNYVLEVFNELKISIPSDIEIATVDSFSVSYSTKESIAMARHILVPPIIAVQNTKAMGEKAVELICESISDPGCTTQKIRIPTKIINF